jgi:putative zinc finger protein
MSDHSDVGAYALGLLEEADRREFEAHLARCPSCAAELQELSGTAAALRELKSMPEPTPPPAPENEDQEKAPRQRKAGTYVIGTIAAAALLALGFVLGSRTGSEPSGTASTNHTNHNAQQQYNPATGKYEPASGNHMVITGERRLARDTKSGAVGTIGMDAMGWGTHIGLELRNVRGPLKCRMEAVSRTGERTVIATWDVPPAGYGVAESPLPLVTHGGTSIKRQDLARFEILVKGGDKLLTIPI